MDSVSTIDTISALTKLPNDLLAEILHARRSDAALRLWKCGSGPLNRKLAQCVETIELKDNSPLSTSRWPKALAQFKRLRKLVVRRPDHRLDTLDKLREGLKSLSPTLEHLELSCIFSLVAFYKPESVQAVKNKWAVRLPELETTHQPVYRRSATFDGIAMWDLQSTFPHLQTLVIGGQLAFLSGIQLQLLSDRDFAALPRSMTCLDLSTRSPRETYSAQSWKCFDQLPRGLKTLRIPLTKTNDPFLTSENLKTLPPTLTELSGMDYLAAHDTTLDSSELVQALPPTITKMEGTTFPNSWALPSNFVDCVLDRKTPLPLPFTLTSVHISHTNITGHDLAKLPRTVTKLFLDQPFLAQDLQASHFPAFLLHFESLCHIPSPVLALLPLTVTSVTCLASKMDDMDSYFGALPPRLKVLDFYPHRDKFVLASATASLPRGLTTLELPGCDARDSVDTFVAGLPPKLTSLALHLSLGPSPWHPWVDARALSWPNTLTELVLFRAPLDLEYWKSLPPILTRLEHSQHPGEGTLDAHGHFINLPRGLRHLGLSNLTFHGADIKDLPRELRSLADLSFVGSGRVMLINWQAKHISNFPPHIKRIQIHFGHPTKAISSKIIWRFPKTFNYQIHSLKESSTQEIMTKAYSRWFSQDLQTPDPRILPSNEELTQPVQKAPSNNCDVM